MSARDDFPLARSADSEGLLRVDPVIWNAAMNEIDRLRAEVREADDDRARAREAIRGQTGALLDENHRLANENEQLRSTFISQPTTPQGTAMNFDQMIDRLRGLGSVPEDRAIETITISPYYDDDDRWMVNMHFADRDEHSVVTDRSYGFFIRGDAILELEMRVPDGVTVTGMRVTGGDGSIRLSEGDLEAIRRAGR